MKKFFQSSLNLRHLAITASLAVVLVLALGGIPDARSEEPADWKKDWPDTDFSQHLIEWDEIIDGGVPRGGIMAISKPRFTRITAPYPLDLGDEEPVIVFEHDGDARAYPLRVLMPHEIVNDVFGELAVVVTYCPLCNTAVVFDRTFNGQKLSFGTTGKLRHSDLIMFDWQTQSWWQQYTGEAIVGGLTGGTLKTLPSRLESLASFRERYPAGKILLPLYSDAKAYVNPYKKYDSRSRPYKLFDGKMPKGISPMARVVAVENRAWELQFLVKQGTITQGDLLLKWTPGQNSALDKEDISKGRDVGNVVVQRVTPEGVKDVPYYVTFAFVFHSFFPDSPIVKE